MRPGDALAPHEYHQRLEEIATAFAGRYGQVECGSTVSASGETAKLVVRVQIPGWDLPLRATLGFVEKHQWTGSAWARCEYFYDLHIEPRPNGRFAYHWHDGVPHRHCDDPANPRPDHHYEAALFDDIGWAADELFRMANTSISCVGLRPLHQPPPREPAAL